MLLDIVIINNELDSLKFKRNNNLSQTYNSLFASLFWYLPPCFEESHIAIGVDKYMKSSAFAKITMEESVEIKMVYKLLHHNISILNSLFASCILLRSTMILWEVGKTSFIVPLLDEDIYVSLVGMSYLRSGNI